MSIECVTRPALTVIGLLVVAEWRELPRAVPAAWSEFFAREPELTPSCGPLGEHLEVSISLQDDTYRELVGVVVIDQKASPPRGMTKLAVPANRYLRLVHDGPLAGIADGFRALYDRAAAEGLEATEFKLDIGYRPGQPAGRHELLIGLGPFAAPQLG